MLDKIKQNRRMVLIAIMSVAIILLAIVAIIFGLKKAPDYTFEEYNNKYEAEEKKYENADSNINFDGELDDGVWGKKRWLDVEHLTDSTIHVRMTSYFGEDGLYMAFDVDDLGIYHNKNRDASYNSGIQLYLSSLSGAKDITGYGYEITMNAGNKTDVKIYQNGAYEMYPGKVEIATKIKGELNSADAKGYTMEAFIDYDMLGGEVDSVFANPAITRSFSDEKDERQWYCFGLESRGASWTRADTWWTFDREGLVAYDVSIDSTENGKIEGQSYAVQGDDYTFEVVPNKGYYAAYLLINNKDVTKDLYYNKGKTYYTVEGAKEDLKIKATFMPVPANKINISGKISDGSATIKGVKAWAVKNGYAEPLSVDANGNYSATVPAIEGLQIFVEAPEYVSACVTAKNGVNNITLQKEYFGENKSVKRSSSDVKFWDLKRLYENRVRLKSAEHGMQLVHSNIYSNSVYASANVITNASKGIDTRAGFTFYKDANTSVIIVLTMNGEVNKNNPKGVLSCEIQMITEQKGEYTWGNDGIVVPLENQKEIINAATSEAGIPVAVHYCNGMFDVWVNGEQVGYCIYPTNENGQNLLDANTKMAVGLECWSNKAVYENLKFDGNYPVRTLSNVAGWDLSQLNKGIAKSLINSGWTQAMLTTGYENKINISANIPLPLEKGKDTRAGFYFKNKKGEDVFIALTMNGEKNQYNPTGDLYYTLQVISKNYTSWDFTGAIEDISQWEYVKTAASSKEGLPMDVYVEDGKFTIAINGCKVAEDIYASDKNGKNILADDTAIMAGLATSETKMVFTNVAINSEKPNFKDASNLYWDFSKISQGEVTLNKKEGGKTILWPELRDKYYITSNIVLSPAADDVRSGYRFEDADGNAVYVALLCEKGGKYEVQVIHTSIEGETNWVWGSSYLDDTYGIKPDDTKGVPVEVLFANGKFSIWVNNKNVCSDVVLKVGEKEVFAQGTSVSAGLECWNTAGQFYKLAAYDKRQVNSEPIPEVITQQAGGEISIISGDYNKNDKYVVLTGQLKALDNMTHDWTQAIVLGVSGEAKWENYAFQLAYGQSSAVNLVKLINGKGYGNFNGVEITQEQWYNNAKLERPFSDGGMKVKLVRMNTWAYLLADMGAGYELIGKMHVDTNLPTQFTLYNDNTALSMSDINIETGKKAVLEALNNGPIPDAVTQQARDEIGVIFGGETNEKHVVMTGRLKALDNMTHDWSQTIVLGVSGTKKWENYAFQLAYGQNSDVNLVKLINGKGYGNFNGVEITQEQWYNNAKLEKPFSEEGMNVKVVRMNTWAYLLVDMGKGYELIGKMYVDTSLPTQFTLYNDNTALSMSDIDIKFGEKAVLDALNGATLDVCPTTYFPINSTKWTLQGKLKGDSTKLTRPVNRIAYVGTDTWFNNLAVVYRTDEGFEKWGTENLHSWSWADIDKSYIDLMNSGNMWICWERDGDTLSFFVSKDGENWTHISDNTNLGINVAGLYVQSEGEFDTMFTDITLMVEGVEDLPSDSEDNPVETAPIKYEPKVEGYSKNTEFVQQEINTNKHSPATGDANYGVAIICSLLLVVSVLYIYYQGKRRMR